MTGARALTRPLAICRGVCSLAWTASMVAGARAEEVLGRSPEGVERYKRHWARGLLNIAGIRLAVEGAQPDVERYLLVSNHRSPLDIVVLQHLCGGIFLSRHDVEKWPVVGAAAKRAGTLFVNREDPMSRMDALSKLTSHLRKGTGPVTVFPEGTTSRADNLLPFQRGSFSAALRAGAPVLPVGLAYPEGLEFVDEPFATHVLRLAERPRLTIGVCLGGLMPASGNSKAAAAQAHEAVLQLMKRARDVLHR